ncbi:hypothetical protein NDU88_002752 [Pleurodeles waltl]|uniref:Uncharacterized protein n=1 Tax=Pleurodeles waltl TaxID=8319 RepID=A0AAV7T3E9_PLEWA|nr:hypothetical protein NDU88_002752 [Pleurodeles waltl]
MEQSEGAPDRLGDQQTTETTPPPTAYELKKEWRQAMEASAMIGEEPGELKPLHRRVFRKRMNIRTPTVRLRRPRSRAYCCPGSRQAQPTR